MPNWIGLEASGLSFSSFAKVVSAISEIPAAVLVEGQIQVEFIAKVLEQAIHDEFIAGGHDRTGAWNDPSDYKDDYVHTIDTLDMTTGPLSARISMRGGAAYVEFGTDRHPIVAKNYPFLTFKVDPDTWIHKVEVDHPGYAGDDFVERAIDTLPFAQVMGSMLEAVSLRVSVASSAYDFGVKGGIITARSVAA